MLSRTRVPRRIIRHHSATSAFTLLELMVVLLILTLLAITGSLTYNTIVTNVRDQAAMENLDALRVSAQSSYGFGGTPRWQAAMEAAAEEVVNSKALGEQLPAFDLLLDDGSDPQAFAVDETDVSYAYGLQLLASGEEADVMGAATVSLSGNCVATVATSQAEIRTWSAGQDLGANCNGSFALSEQDTADFLDPDNVS